MSTENLDMASPVWGGDIAKSEKLKWICNLRDIYTIYIVFHLRMRSTQDSKWNIYIIYIVYHKSDNKPSVSGKSDVQTLRFKISTPEMIVLMESAMNSWTAPNDCHGPVLCWHPANSSTSHEHGLAEYGIKDIKFIRIRLRWLEKVPGSMVMYHRTKKNTLN